MATDPKKDKHAPYPSQHEPDENRDPITGAPGSHPVGTGLGAVGGGAAGAAVGAAAGPIGAVVGAAVGGIAGGLIGKGVAEGVNPTDEHAYWEQNYKNQPYYRSEHDYTAYGPAYQYGWESCTVHRDRRFEEVEPELRREWESRRSSRDLTWEDARPAVCDAWQRAEQQRATQQQS